MKIAKARCTYCNGTGEIDVTGLRQLRESKGLTQERVANESGITRQQYSNIELGTSSASVRSARDIACILGVSVDSLLDILLGEVPNKTEDSSDGGKE